MRAGFKFHPNLQAFFPNDRMAYPLYEVIAEAGLPALFHTGHSGIGSGLPGGGGIRLKYSNPMHVDDVAVDFPGMPIILAHPSFPWQDEALSVAMHKAQVYIDLSGWSPKLLPADPRAVREHGRSAQGAVRVGLPGDHARPLAGRLRDSRHQGRSAPADPQGKRGQAVRLASVSESRVKGQVGAAGASRAAFDGAQPLLGGEGERR